MIRHAHTTFLLAATAAGILLTTLAGSALAQEEPTGPPDKSSWVLGYALTILGVALGLLAICRPGNRSSDIRVEED